MRTPLVRLPEMTLPGPITFSSESLTLIPLKRFPTAAVPAALVPMKFAVTMFSVETLDTRMPFCAFPEMTLPGPTVLPVDELRMTPCPPFPRAAVPAAFTPIQVFVTTVDTELPVNWTPSPTFPDTSVSPTSAEPTTLPAPAPIPIPAEPFGTAAVPVGFVPIRFPATTLLSAPEPMMRTPLAPLPEMTLDAEGQIRAPDEVARRAHDRNAVDPVGHGRRPGDVRADVVAADHVVPARLQDDPVAAACRKRRVEPVDHQSRHEASASRDPQSVRAGPRRRPVDLDDRRPGKARLRRAVDVHRPRHRRQRRDRLDRLRAGSPDDEADRVGAGRCVGRKDRLAQRTVCGVAHSVVEIVRGIDGESGGNARRRSEGKENRRDQPGKAHPGRV